MFQQIRLPELLIIGAIILLLFGAKRLPDAARGLGRSMRIFKAETKSLRESDDSKAATPTSELPGVENQAEPTAAPTNTDQNPA